MIHGYIQSKVAFGENMDAGSLRGVESKRPCQRGLNLFHTRTWSSTFVYMLCTCTCSSVTYNSGSLSYTSKTTALFSHARLLLLKAVVRHSAHSTPPLKKGELEIFPICRFFASSAKLTDEAQLSWWHDLSFVGNSDLPEIASTGSCHLPVASHCRRVITGWEVQSSVV